MYYFDIKISKYNLEIFSFTATQHFNIKIVCENMTMRLVNVKPI